MYHCKILKSLIILVIWEFDTPENVQEGVSSKADDPNFQP